MFILWSKRTLVLDNYVKSDIFLIKMSQNIIYVLSKQTENMWSSMVAMVILLRNTVYVNLLLTMGYDEAQI